MFTHHNDCEGQQGCAAPRNLEADYVYNGNNDFGVRLQWDAIR
ncbi:MAG: hypothetical protein ACTTKO_04365 [Candidatus Limimorpha sp.]